MDAHRHTLYNAARYSQTTVVSKISVANWKPSWAIKVMVLVLVMAIAVTLWQPQWWMWALGVVIANQLILTIAGLLPRSRLLGPNLTRLPPSAASQGKVAITIDDGPDPQVTPKVLEILDRYQAKATFFCIGKLALRHPELCREIIRRGHAIENHSWSHHLLFSLFGPWSISREVGAAQSALSEVCGQIPRFFRPTAGLRNLALDPVLAYHGLQLCSWSKRGFDTRVKDGNAVLNSLTRNLKGGDILLLHDGNAARSANGQPVILEVLPRLLEKIQKADLHPVTLRSAIQPHD